MISLQNLLRAGTLLLGTAVPATAQTVVGRLVDQETGEPLRTAFVVLLDSAGVERGGILTSPEGRYVLRAPGPGRYTVRAELIGYATHTSPVLELGRGGSTTYDAALSFAAVKLDAIEVEGEQRCTVRPGAGLRTAEVWDEARKALRLAAWTEEQEAVRFRAVNYELDLDAQARKVLSERRSGRSGYIHGSPYESLPPEDLARDGYVRSAPGDGWTYFAPDARVMLSDPFLDGHCFELTEDRSRPELIGLAFRPVSRSRNADIRGVLWLDRQSSELRYLEFTYVDLPYPVESDLLGGRVDFDRLEGGPWIVRSWRIRTPQVALVRQRVGAFGGGGESYRVTGIHEVGAEVQDVEGGEGASLLGEAPVEGRGSLRGAAYDPVGARPLAGAEVTLTGTSRRARTGEDGTFEVTGLRPGRYAVRVTPATWEMPWLPPPVGEVDVAEGSSDVVELRLPDTSAIVRSLCAGAVSDTVPGAVVGRLTDAVTGAPVTRRAVVVSWGGFGLSGNPNRVNVQSHAQWTSATTGGDGWYLACGIPVDVLVRVRAVPVYDSPQQTASRLWLLEGRLPPDARDTRLGPDAPMERVDLQVRRGAAPRSGPERRPSSRTTVPPLARRSVRR